MDGSYQTWTRKLLFQCIGCRSLRLFETSKLRVIFHVRKVHLTAGIIHTVRWTTVCPKSFAQHLPVCLSMRRWCLEMKKVSFWWQAVDEDCSCANSSHLRELVRTWGAWTRQPLATWTRHWAQLRWMSRWMDLVAMHASHVDHPLAPRWRSMSDLKWWYTFFWGEIRNEINEISHLIYFVIRTFADQRFDYSWPGPRPVHTGGMWVWQLANPCPAAMVSKKNWWKLVKRSKEATVLQIGFCVSLPGQALRYDGRWKPLFLLLGFRGLENCENSIDINNTKVKPSVEWAWEGMVAWWVSWWVSLRCLMAWCLIWCLNVSWLEKARASHVADSSPSLGDLAFWKEPGIEQNLSREEHHKCKHPCGGYTQIYLGYLHLRTSHHSNFNFSFEVFSQEASTWQLETLAAAGRQKSCHSSTAGAAEVLRRGRWMNVNCTTAEPHRTEKARKSGS